MYQKNTRHQKYKIILFINRRMKCTDIVEKDRNYYEFEKLRAYIIVSIELQNYQYMIHFISRIKLAMMENSYIYCS